MARISCEHAQRQDARRDADRAALAAREADSADQRGRRRERQHVEADVRRARGGEAVAEQRARQRRPERRDDEHADEQPVDRDAGHARRPPVAADRADVPADAQVAEHERGDDEDPERDQAPDREDLQDRLVEPEADRVVLVDARS